MFWFHLKDGVRDLDFVETARRYLEHLKTEERVSVWRITRCKLDLNPFQLT